MRIRYSLDAIADLVAVREFIANENPRAADTVVARIMQSVTMLEDFPKAGREGRIPGTRELPILRLPYFAVYRVGGDSDLFVLSVVHTSRQWPPDEA